jgi:hypothetical protein
MVKYKWTAGEIQVDGLHEKRFGKADKSYE